MNRPRRHGEARIRGANGLAVAVPPTRRTSPSGWNRNQAEGPSWVNPRPSRRASSRVFPRSVSCSLFIASPVFGSGEWVARGGRRINQ